MFVSALSWLQKLLGLRARVWIKRNEVKNVEKNIYDIISEIRITRCKIDN